MSDRPRSGRAGNGPRHPSPGDEVAPRVAPAAPEPTGAVAGIAGEAATRSGEDTRRRGWFWHWNSIVTQYAPLIGLKGVGLLNSYTVWTDRREESPHRGYAFPSQQSEADFYGEDRAELITINKILVALDLIEIRKEMVLRVDEQGRRWKVPHNFYRVKDHDDGFALTTRDVLRVVELADRDARRLPLRAPDLLPPLRADRPRQRLASASSPRSAQTEVWQRLAARAAREEDRASARTRAGHAARKGALGMPAARDTAAPSTGQNDIATVANGEAEETSVATINTGSLTTVAPANSGLAPDPATIVGPVNAAPVTAVGQSNRTYHEEPLTTTTTTDTGPSKEEQAGVPGDSDPVDNPSAGSHSAVTTGPDVVTGDRGIGPGARPAPEDAAGEAAAIRAFEDANGRRSTPAERQILRGLAERFDPPARVGGDAALATGWAWLAAAVYEAVEAGSAYVAPRRLREILSRWEREGVRDGQAGRRAGGQDGSAVDSQAPIANRQSPIVLRDEPDFALPHGFGSRRTWEFTVGLLAGAIGAERLADLVRGTAIVGYREGEVTIAANPAQADLLAGPYRELVARKLGEALRRPVRVAVLAADAQGADGQTGRRADGQTPAMASSPLPPEGEGSGVRFAASQSPIANRQSPSSQHFDDAPATPHFLVAECGLPNAQVWAAVLDEVAVSGGVSRANIDAWLRTTALIGRDDAGALIVGVPHGLAQRRIATRFLGPLRAAAAAITGADLPLDIVVAADWLRANPAPTRPTPTGDAGAA